MLGRSRKSSPIHIEKNGVTLTNIELVNALNAFFSSVNADIPTFDLNELPTFLPSADQVPLIHPYQVCKKLLNLNPYKAMGPDNIPPRVLKEFAYELADPIAEIFNLSLSSGVAHTIWKVADICPIPKETLPKEENDLRPISLTSCLSKVLEEFVVGWLLKDIGDKIDSKQFGCMKGTSTTLCLLDMLHNWLSNLDTPGQFLRVCFLDFSKAFDRINLNTLVTKLVDLGVRRTILPWICSFLSDRKQRVKLGESVSEWATVNAGVPQGTKLGPILFLVMVNDLTISEVISRHGSSSMQSDLDYISSWASANYMMLNPKKCKELRICFFRETLTVFPLIIDGKPVDIVDSHKVLGIEINSSLKWSDQVDKITKKAAKRLYIIRVLRRSGLSSDEFISIYTATG